MLHRSSYSFLGEQLLGGGKAFPFLHLLLILFVSKLVQLLSLAVDGSLGLIGAITHRQDASTTSYLMQKHCLTCACSLGFPSFLHFYVVPQVPRMWLWLYPLLKPHIGFILEIALQPLDTPNPST